MDEQVADQRNEPSDVIFELSDVALDGIRQHFLVAQRERGTFYAISEARKVAEALCAALAAHVPASYKKYGGADLNERIATLEKATYKQELEVPRAVLAALRSIQAYGNYASHFDPDKHTAPPKTATASAMSSLDLLVSWVLDHGDEEQSLELRTRTSKPTFFRRWRIARRVKSSAPKLPDENALGKTTETRLASLLRVCEQSASMCTEICRIVLEQESAAPGLENKKLSELSLLFARLAYLCPTRIPPSVARDIDWLVQTRSSVLRAIQVGEADADKKFLTELKHRNVAKEVERWFDRDYLGKTTFERFAAIWFLLVPFVAWVAWGSAQGCIADGRDAYRNQLIKDHCSGVQDDTATLCDRLRTEAAEENSPGSRPATPQPAE